RDDTASYLSNNDQLINKIPVIAANTTTPNILYRLTWEDPVLKRMALGSERIWFATEAAQLPPSDELFAAIKTRASKDKSFPIVVHSQEQMLMRTRNAQGPSVQELISQVEKLPKAEKIPVRLLNYEPEELRFDVNCPAEGWLLVTDRWARSW